MNKNGFDTWGIIYCCPFGIALGLLVAFVDIRTQSAQEPIQFDERQVAAGLAEKYAAEVEVRLWDNTRVDLLSAEYAWEVDRPVKWSEAIGQALYYSLVTGKKPGIILLQSDPAEARFIYRCQAVCAKYDIRLEIEKP